MRIEHWIAVAGLSFAACLTKDTACPNGQMRDGRLCRDKSLISVSDAGDDASLLPGDEPDRHHHTEPSAQLDAGTQPRICYLDLDGDSVGYGDPVDCDHPVAEADAAIDDPDASVDSTADASVAAKTRPATSDRNDDCDDSDPNRSPMLNEACDGVDNDCDGRVDNEVSNACGGPCVPPFQHELGTACSNGLLGVCALEGTYECSYTEVVCSAQKVYGGFEICDGKDNDCDGNTDEADASDRPTWFQDCDGDGYAQSSIGSQSACTAPAAIPNCKAWVRISPQGANQDCDDTNAAYHPNASYGLPSGSQGTDLDCDEAPPEKEAAIAFNGGDAAIRLCAPGEALNGACGYWIGSGGTRTDEQPPCSANVSDTYSFARKLCFTGLCPDGGSISFSEGLQRCR